MATSPDIHVLLAGGGSGGHVFPALAVGEELTSRGCTVSFAGSPVGMEARLVPARGVPFHPLRSRPVVGRGLGGKLLALATLGLSALAGARLVRRLGARAVLGTGGYASGPAVLGARLARRPVLLLEPNARAGVANRQLSRFAAGAAIAFPGAGGDLACPTRATGVPVRKSFFEVAPALPATGLRLLVLGGSQGAQSLNRALPRLLGGADGLLARLPEVTVLHQTGAAHLDAARAGYREAGVAVEAAGGRGRVRLAPFIDDVAGAMAESHLVVSRAGAITVAEIAAAGRPSVLVPITLAGGHQEDNARALEVAGASRAVFEPAPGSTPEERARALATVLGDTLGLLLGDRQELERMAAAAHALGKPGAAGAIADWLLELTGAAGSAAQPTPGGAA